MKKTKNEIKKNENGKYFLVTAKCGHVRRGNYIPITFAVRAENGKQAAAIARELPRVKHDHPDAILSVTEVTVEEYARQRKVNEYDPYLCVSTRKDHNSVLGLFEHRILPENRTAAPGHKTEISKMRIYSSKEKIRHPRKWLRMNPAA